MQRGGTSVIVLAFLMALASSSPQTGTKAINSTKTEPRIVGETKAGPNEFPYQVAIFAKGTAVLRCGGALITTNLVLTSAYCASLGNASDIEVMVGNINRSRDSPSELVGVKRIFVHENYNLDGRANDVALLQLSANLSLERASVDVIALSKSAVVAGSQCTFTGWGSDTWNGPVSDVLEKASLNIVSRDSCNIQLDPYVQVDQICAEGREGSNACFLDEGGPLVCGGQLSGILSHSVNCGKKDKPSVYASVFSHRDWIQQKIPSAAIHNTSYVTLLAMLTALASLWSGRT